MLDRLVYQRRSSIKTPSSFLLALSFSTTTPPLSPSRTLVSPHLHLHPRCPPISRTSLSLELYVPFFPPPARLSSFIELTFDSNLSLSASPLEVYCRGYSCACSREQAAFHPPNRTHRCSGLRCQPFDSTTDSCALLHAPPSPLRLTPFPLSPSPSASHQFWPISGLRAAVVPGEHLSSILRLRPSRSALKLEFDRTTDLSLSFFLFSFRMGGQVLQVSRWILPS